MIEERNIVKKICLTKDSELANILNVGVMPKKS